MNPSNDPPASPDQTRAGGQLNQDPPPRSFSPGGVPETPNRRSDRVLKVKPCWGCGRPARTRCVDGELIEVVPAVSALRLAEALEEDKLAQLIGAELFRLRVENPMRYPDNAVRIAKAIRREVRDELAEFRGSGQQREKGR